MFDEQPKRIPREFSEQRSFQLASLLEDTAQIQVSLRQLTEYVLQRHRGTSSFTASGRHEIMDAVEHQAKIVALAIKNIDAQSGLLLSSDPDLYHFQAAIFVGYMSLLMFKEAYVGYLYNFDCESRFQYTPDTDKPSWDSYLDFCTATLVDKKQGLPGTIINLMSWLNKCPFSMTEISKLFEKQSKYYLDESHIPGYLQIGVLLRDLKDIIYVCRVYATCVRYNDTP
jgi:hypothetical protein